MPAHGNAILRSIWLVFELVSCYGAGFVWDARGSKGMRKRRKGTENGDKRRRERKERDGEKETERETTKQR